MSNTHMSNNKNQKGFASIWFIGLIVLIVGIGGYFAWGQVRERSMEKSPAAFSDDTSTWKTYTDTNQGYSFQYPEKLSLSATSEETTLSHSIPFENIDGGCDMEGSAKVSETLDDFGMSLKIVSGVVNPPYIDGNYSKGILQGTYAYMGAGGCGTTNYYFPLSEDKTLIVTKKEVQILSPAANRDVQAKVLAVSEVISYEESQAIFDQVLSTFKFIEPAIKVDTSGWKTYTNTKYGFKFSRPSDWSDVDMKFLDVNMSGNDVDFQTGGTGGNLDIIIHKDEDSTICDDESKWVGDPHNMAPGTKSIEENVEVANVPLRIISQFEDVGGTAGYVVKRMYGCFKTNPATFLELDMYSQGSVDDFPPNSSFWEKGTDVFNAVAKTFKFTNIEYASVAATIDWKNLIPSIRPILKKTFPDFAVESDKPISIYKEADITGDGVPEALVDLGTGAAWSDFFALMKIENGKPVMARFKEKDGTITTTSKFGDGAGGAGRYGSKLKMLSDKNAIYFGNYYIYGDSSDFCYVYIYQWNSKTKTFEYSAELSKQPQLEYCQEAQKEADLINNE